MTGFKIVNLKLMIDEYGEETVRELVSSFSCPLNPDVEIFLRQKAIEFSKQGLSQTHLVLAPFKGKPAIVGYFCLANKSITIKRERLSHSQRKRLSRFAFLHHETKTYILSAPLIAQLGKNYADGLNELITGDELLKMACDKISRVQYDVGGRYIYVECEDKERLLSFYTSNGFFEFDHRMLDKDETNLSGKYLVQLLKYNH